MGTRDESPARRRTDFDHEHKLRILAVDDDPAYLRYLEHVLNRAGFEVEHVFDGNAAVDRLRRNCDVDLLLIDLAMPGLDGIETVAKIQEECSAPALYTILLTARDSVETKLRALNSGLDDFLSKMSTESEIVAKIRSAARRVEMERRLRTLAMTDELTGIANRRAIFLTGEDVLRSNRHLSVILIDLDHFKMINDTLGHLAGDRILADVAGVLKANTRYGDVVGRYGGDEFVVLLPDTEPEEARQISDRILGKIRQLSVSAQSGIAAATTDARLVDLLAVCDQALYRGKRRSRELRPQA
ncbi:MAG TPA: diguanylate cyclase [Thermoanaerobaculia bacterium]|nr:diguanylate cyclase [Thermoanaerobaculia bacterium]